MERLHLRHTTRTPLTGAVSVALLIVVVVTGVYLTLFFNFGFDASHDAVARLTGHPIQRFMRSLHRHSSVALVVAALAHAWRIFFAARFGGARLRRWVTGWASFVFVWVAGVTGYWILWDERSQLINEAMASMIGAFGFGREATSAVLTAQGDGWQVLLIIWFAHVAATAVVGYYMWRHLRRSAAPRLPPRLWAALTAAALVAVSLAFPAELLDQADAASLVESAPLDPFLIVPALLPARLPGLAGPVVFLGLTALLILLPRLPGRKRAEVVAGPAMASPASGARRAIAGAAVVLAPAALAALATTVSLNLDRPESGVLVAVHHEPGAVIAGADGPSGSPGTGSALRVRIGDGAVQELKVGSGGLASAAATFDAPAGETYVLVELVEGDDVTVIHDGVADLKEGRRLVLEARDLGPAGAAAGEELFASRRAGCAVCHSIEPGVELVGPSLFRAAVTAETRAPGMSAEEYLRQSVTDPGAYVVEGYPAGQMPGNLGEKLTGEEMDDLVEFLLTLDG